MTHSFFSRALAAAAVAGLASLAQAQSADLPPVTAASPQTTTTTTTVIEVAGPAVVAPKVISKKPCPIPTGSHFRPSRDENGHCPPESRENEELDTQLTGQGNNTASLMQTMGN